MIYKGSTPTNIALAGKTLRSVYLGATKAVGPGTDVYPQKYWSDENVPPIARWVNAYGDTVEGDSYAVSVVAFESSPNGDIESVEFYVDGSLQETVTERTDLAGTQVGDTVQAFQTTLDTSGWSPGEEKVVTAVVNSSYGTSLSLSGDQTNALLTSPRSDYVPDINNADEASPDWSVTVTRSGFHGLKLYKGQAVTTTTISNLLSTIESLDASGCPAPVIEITDTSGDPGQYWAASLGSGVSAALQDSYITIRGQASARGTTFTGTPGNLNDSNISNSTFALKIENVTFDKTARIGANKSVFLKNCQSSRGLVPWSSSTHGDPPGVENTDWERGTGEFSDYFKKAGTTQWLAYSGDVPNGGDTSYTNIMRFGNTSAATVYHSCSFSEYSSLYKRSTLCWDCESEFAWLDTYANVGAVIGCAAWNMPYGYNPSTNSQYHNDILQNASNMVNAVFYSIRSYKRSTVDGDGVDDIWGNQGQFFSFRDKEGRDALWNGFVLKDILFLGNEPDSQGQFALGLYNALIENVILLQEKADDGSPGKGLNWSLTDNTEYTDNNFVKYRWGHIAASRIPIKTGLANPIRYAQTDPEYIPQIEKFATFKNIVLGVPQFPAISQDNVAGSGLGPEEYTFNGETKTWDAWHTDGSLFSAYNDKIGSTMSFANSYFVGGTNQGGVVFQTPTLPSGISYDIPVNQTEGAPSRLGGPTRDSAWFSSFAGLS